ncbi:MAG TPA: hypothetical protein DEA43_00575 [Candidatus Moranbacteria bacterium]|nr:hypothetical protein [Candidatus Moranbacteria bacterium]HBT45366.1 hypothetical protein [Candidatus Moranbacteria bacterium]
MDITKYPTSLNLSDMTAYVDGYSHLWIDMNDALVTFEIDEKSQTIPWKQNEDRLKHMLQKASHETNFQQYTRVILNGKVEIRGNSGRILFISSLSFKVTTAELLTETPAEQRDRNTAEFYKNISEQTPVPAKDVASIIEEVHQKTLRRMTHKY